MRQIKEFSSIKEANEYLYVVRDLESGRKPTIHVFENASNPVNIYITHSKMTRVVHRSKQTEWYEDGFIDQIEACSSIAEANKFLETVSTVNHIQFVPTIGKSLKIFVVDDTS